VHYWLSEATQIDGENRSGSSDREQACTSSDAYPQAADYSLLIPVPQRRIALLSAIQTFILSTKVEIADPFWEELYEHFTGKARDASAGSPNAPM
jgi:hypothetical protein